MRKLVLLICFFVLTMYTFNTSLLAEDVTASKGQPSVIAGEEKKPVVGTSSVAEEQPSIAHSKDESLEDTSVIDEDLDYADDIDDIEATYVKDSLPRYNRAVFAFNDKLYYYGIRPISNGYKAVVPEVARLGVRNFFTNLKMPIRFFNCLFQGKLKGAGTELSRLVINSTIGVAGFSDPAKKYFNLELQGRDFGQTLGKYGIGSGTHLQLPFLGPSSVRGAFGYLGDAVLNPLTILSFFVSPYITTGAGIYNELNEFSIDKGNTYEGLVEDAIDPYIAVQDAYAQNRAKKIKE